MKQVSSPHTLLAADIKKVLEFSGPSDAEIIIPLDTGKNYDYVDVVHIGTGKVNITKADGESLRGLTVAPARQPIFRLTKLADKLWQSSMYAGVTPPSEVPDPPTNVFSKLVFTMGQSMIVGDGGQPNLRNTPELANLPNMKLLKGVDTNGNGEDLHTTDDLSSLKDFAEFQTDQTHAWAYGNWIKVKGSDEFSIYTTNGRGATGIVELTSSPIIDDRTPIIDAAVGLLPTGVKQGVIQISQGEWDTTNGTDIELWKSTLLAEVNTCISVMSAAGCDDVQVFLCQISKGNTHPSGGYQIANAQLELVRDNANFHMAAMWPVALCFGLPNYQPHFSADGFSWMGEFLAQTELKALGGKAKVIPPYPVSFSVRDDLRTIDVVYGGETDGLVVGVDASEANIPHIAGSGFGIGENSNHNTILPTTSQVLSETNGVHTLTLVSPVLLETGVELSAGRIDHKWADNILFRIPTINLRGTSNENSLVTGRSMHCWAAQFTKTLGSEHGAFDKNIDNLWNENIDPAFTLPPHSISATTISTAAGVVVYDKIILDSLVPITYMLKIKAQIVSGTLRVTFCNSTIFRTSYTAVDTVDGLLDITIPVVVPVGTTASAFKVDFNGSHDIELLEMGAALAA